MPSVPSTAVIPSKSGIPAATSAPNASRRIASVRGREMSPAFLRSSLKAPSICFPVLSPNDPT